MRFYRDQVQGILEIVKMEVDDVGDSGLPKQNPANWAQYVDYRRNSPNFLPTGVGLKEDLFQPESDQEVLDFVEAFKNQAFAHLKEGLLQFRKGFNLFARQSVLDRLPLSVSLELLKAPSEEAFNNGESFANAFTCDSLCDESTVEQASEAGQVAQKTFTVAVLEILANALTPTERKGLYRQLTATSTLPPSGKLVPKSFKINCAPSIATPSILPFDEAKLAGIEYSAADRAAYSGRLPSTTSW
jgi:hypothetical protein